MDWTDAGWRSDYLCVSHKTDSSHDLKRRGKNDRIKMSKRKELTPSQWYYLLRGSVQSILQHSYSEVIVEFNGFSLHREDKAQVNKTRAGPFPEDAVQEWDGDQRQWCYSPKHNILSSPFNTGLCYLKHSVVEAPLHLGNNTGRTICLFIYLFL